MAAIFLHFPVQNACQVKLLLHTVARNWILGGQTLKETQSRCTERARQTWGTFQVEPQSHYQCMHGKCRSRIRAHCQCLHDGFSTTSEHIVGVHTVGVGTNRANFVGDAHGRDSWPFEPIFNICWGVSSSCGLCWLTHWMVPQKCTSQVDIPWGGVQSRSFPPMSIPVLSNSYCRMYPDLWQTGPGSDLWQRQSRSQAIVQSSQFMQSHHPGL